MTTAIMKFQNMALPKRENTKKVVFSGVLILSVLVGTYVYFVGKIVFDVVGRRQAEATIRSTQSKVGMLESKYLATLQSLDINSLASVGLSESHDTLYASRAVSETQASAIQNPL